MSSFRQPVSRRKLLGGAGVAVALPFLESLAWRRFASAATCAAPRRVLVYHVPNGVYMKGWMPKDDGPNYTLSPTLQSIAPIRDDVLLVTGLVNGVGSPLPDPGGAHGFGSAALLTCVQAVRSGPNLGKSFDQVVADGIGSCTKLRSLELGMDTTEGGAETNTPIIFNRNISWSGPSTPMPHIVDPKAAFDRLFAGFDPRISAADSARRQADRASVLDRVLADSNRLTPKLGSGDRKKMDEYMSAVRDVETRLQAVAAQPARACPIPAPPASGGDYPTNLNLMHEIIALAFQCDATRMITMSLGNALSTRPYSWLNIGNSHGVTHHGPDPALVAQAIQIDKWRLDQLVKLVTRLKGITDSDGNSLLRNMVLYYTSEIADGDNHSQHNKPVLLVGQMGGVIQTGRHLAASPVVANWTDANYAYRLCMELVRLGCGDTQLSNLYVTFMRAMGLQTDKFANSTGALTLN